MKLILCALLFGRICLAEEEPPKHARVSIQYIEVAHAALTDLVGEGKTGGAIHVQAIALAKGGEAKILETCMVVCRSGYEAAVQSVMEDIFPRQVEADDFRFTARASNPPYMDQAMRSFPIFETKDIGTIFVAGLTIDAESSAVDLRIMSDFIQRNGLGNWMEHKDQWGDASLRMPNYEKWATNTSLTLLSGKSELASVITPEAQRPAPAVSRRILLFVRADVIESPVKP